MAGPETPFAQLKSWVDILTDLQSGCIHRGIIKGVQFLLLNAFARAKVLSTLKASGSNQTDFLNRVVKAVAEPFPASRFNPKSSDFTLGDQTDFKDVADWVSPSSLQHSVIVFAWGSAGDDGLTFPGARPISELFKTDESWRAFWGDIERSNLDAVLGEPAKVMEDLKKLRDQNPPKTFNYLVDFLIKIQPVAGANGKG
jgi:hypothetical protein